LHYVSRGFSCRIHITLLTWAFFAFFEKDKKAKRLGILLVSPNTVALLVWYLCTVRRVLSEIENYLIPSFSAQRLANMADGCPSRPIRQQRPPTNQHYSLHIARKSLEWVSREDFRERKKILDVPPLPTALFITLLAFCFFPDPYMISTVFHYHIHKHIEISTTKINAAKCITYVCTGGFVLIIRYCCNLA